MRNFAENRLRSLSNGIRRLFRIGFRDALEGESEACAFAAAGEDVYSAFGRWSGIERQGRRPYLRIGSRVFGTGLCAGPGEGNAVLGRLLGAGREGARGSIF